MLLDIGAVLGGIGLAVVAFLVVILVCVVILRLLAAILPSYEDRDAVTLPEEPMLSNGPPASALPGAPVPAEDLAEPGQTTVPEANRGPSY